MGLLDSLDDPKTAGLLSLGLRLMSTPGQFGMALGQAGMGAMGDIQAARAQAMQRQLQSAQLEDVKQQALLRQMQAAKALQSQQMAAQLMGGASTTQPASAMPQPMPATPSGMPGFSGQSAPPAAPMGAAPTGTALSRLNEDQVIGLIMSGAPDKLYDAWKFAKTGEQAQPGTFLRRPDGSMQYIPDVKTGLDFKDGKVSVLPGAADSLGTITGATASATEAAKAPYSIQSIQRPDGSTVQMPVSEFLAARQARSAGVPERVAAAAAAAGDKSYNFDVGGQRGGYGGDLGVSPNSTQQASAAALKENATKTAASAADYEANLNSKVAAGRELVRRVNEQEKLLDQFKTGATGPLRSKIALIARDMGAPESLVTGIAAGDPTAAQEFTKFAAQTNLEQLKQAIGANRMLKTEFDAFSEANPSIASDPQAIKKVFSWLRDTYGKDYQEQQALREYRKSGGDMTDFPGWFSAREHQSLMGSGPAPSPPIAGPAAKPQTINDIAAAAKAELERRRKMLPRNTTGSW